ncbi:PREDICTED: TERF1-interacting nuclear factor 2 [Nanorana parkeri]|uniref:TERF1-interacting nuclear factor 2 n=1 Tax=Nanorana parkeri TaxID=125878 RepID=UPI0008546E5F|nr:PREDICTED: TERF1-interacting nuclear factor 2 [Nanorana parkeri]
MSSRSRTNAGACQHDVSLVAKAVWLVMQRRDFKNFERIVEFLELTHKQAPGLLCYRHHARLSTGLRGKIVLNMIEDKRPLLDILEALNLHFPPVCPDDSTTPPRDVAKVQQSKIHFRKLVYRMIRDEKFRKDYLETRLEAEYGEMYLKALDKLLWEFLYRLQAVLDQEAPKTTEQSHLEREDLAYTPVPPVSLSTSDKSVTSMQQDRSYLFYSDSSAKEPQKSLQAGGKMHPNCQEDEVDSASNGDGYDSDQTIIEFEDSQDISRIPSGPMCGPDGSRRASNQSTAVEKSRTRFFDIFGFDCSENSKGNHVDSLSPPNALQSQDTDHNMRLQGDSAHGRAKNKTRVSLVKDSRGGTKVAPPKSHALPAHEQRNPASCVSGIKNKEQSEAGWHLLQELTSSRFQPKVQLKPLPLDLVSKYIHSQPHCAESDSAPSTAYCGLTQDSTCTYSWLVDSSATPDDYRNDPDYYPGCDI